MNKLPENLQLIVTRKVKDVWDLEVAEVNLKPES